MSSLPVAPSRSVFEPNTLTLRHNAANASLFDIVCWL
jgi:hypothetical protein